LGVLKGTKKSAPPPPPNGTSRRVAPLKVGRDDPQETI